MKLYIIFTLILAIGFMWSNRGRHTLVRNTIINFSLAGLTITFCWDSIQRLSDDTITRYVEIAFIVIFLCLAFYLVKLGFKYLHSLATKPIEVILPVHKVDSYHNSMFFEWLDEDDDNIKEYINRDVYEGLIEASKRSDDLKVRVLFHDKAEIVYEVLEIIE